MQPYRVKYEPTTLSFYVVNYLMVLTKFVPNSWPLKVSPNLQV